MSLLLDTHAAIWLDAGLPLVASTRVEIENAAADAAVFLSPITAWETALLVSKGRVRLPWSPREWFDQLLGRPGMRLAALEPAAAVDAATLPGLIHGDPADRFLIATARHFDLTLVTRDKLILAYAETGALRALRC